ncbi:MAG: superoxide dismutase [uncultured bacterium (gcode 4)]|uniref:Superoxide dismutase n=1 Tax=uncultured bacterium (gcode 4) TaxID=1234023 RepID=K1XHH0_9BACT|nr:MAG: superoxide dismutase [uncultured bacterium (gcode 4)]
MITLEKLPYAVNALEPVIDVQTIELHYGKHHQGYVNKLNELIVGTVYADEPLENIVKTSDWPIFNNAAQTWNHTFYRNELQTPKENNLPTWALLDGIIDIRGTFEKFQEAMIASAVGNFWSGWTWLVQHTVDGTLEIMNTSNAGCPLTTNKKALLTIDVREHAYYLKYQNRRVEYVTNIWKCINRDIVSERLG